MEGGDLRWFWSGFELYERIDNVCSLQALDITEYVLTSLLQVYSVQGYLNKAGFAPAAGRSFFFF